MDIFTEKINSNTSPKSFSMRLTNAFKLGIAGAVLTMMAGTANAIGYCSAGTQTSGLAVGDVTFNTVASNDCYGVVDLANQNPDTITNFANNNNLWTPGPWDFLVRDDNSTGNSGPVSYGDITFTLAASQGANGQPIPSEWTLTVTDNDLNNPPSIPFMMDFLVYLHAGSNSAYYLFDDRLINTDNTGTFQITFTAGNGNSNSFPGLSGLSLLARDLDDINPPVVIPEPSLIMLLGIGLLGLAATRRRNWV